MRTLVFSELLLHQPARINRKENVIVRQLIPAGTGLREYTRQVVMTNDEHEAALAAKVAKELVPTKRPSRAGKREASVSAE